MSRAASAGLKDLDVRQILVDEAGTATEPKTLILLVSFSQAKVSEASSELGAWADVTGCGLPPGVQLHGGAVMAVGVRTMPACLSRWFFLGTTAAAACGQE